MRTLTDEYCRWLAWNAAQADPQPICPKCRSPFDPRDAGDLMPAWCNSCESNWVYQIVWRLIGRCGRSAARRHIRALARIRPCAPAVAF